MSDKRADYYRHLQEAGNRFLRGRNRVGPFREFAGGGRVVAVMPAENYHHLRTHHGVSLSCREEVEWLQRHHPEVVPPDGRNAARVAAAGAGGGVRRTRFGIPTFHKVYDSPAMRALAAASTPADMTISMSRGPMS